MLAFNSRWSAIADLTGSDGVELVGSNGAITCDDDEFIAMAPMRARRKQREKGLSVCLCCVNVCGVFREVLNVLEREIHTHAHS